MKGIIFDFDGPIFPGRKAATVALEATYEKFATNIGRPRQSMASAPLFQPRQMIAAAYAEFDVPGDRLSVVRDYYAEQLRRAEIASAATDGVVALLDDLVARGRKLAVLTSRATANVVERLKHLGLSGRFAAVIGVDGTPGDKLDPATIPAIAGTLGVAAADLVLVGDSDIDYQAARKAHIPYYHVAWSGEPTSEARVRANAVAASIDDLHALLKDDEPPNLYRSVALPAPLLEAIGTRSVSFFAGAGISIPSGIGGWDDHYLPVLRKLGAARLVGGDHTLPEILQLLATDPATASSVFDDFRNSFRTANKRANAYHYALLKSHARTIWTTNYDQLFEQAVGACMFEHTMVKSDADLLKNFATKTLIIKMNGDFEGAQYRPDLEWDVVFLEEQFDTAELRRREIWRLFEDEYRNKLIIFVGVSFKDPALRRILSVAAKAIPRSRYQHLLLMKLSDDPMERSLHYLYAEALKRRYIQTLFFSDFASIEHFVCRVAAQAIRPIVGFSGTALARSAAAPTPPPPADALLDPGQIAQLCERAGRALSAHDFRVTSGHGEGVGVPAVTAAFKQNPTSARFYLRERGTTSFSRLAPAIVVPGDTLDAMRQRFVSELDLLIAVGGQKTSEPTSGTVAEIRLALNQKVPVLIVPQAGGDAAEFAPQLAAHVRQEFSDPALAEAICKANATIAAIAPEVLSGFVNTDLPILVGDLIARLMGAGIRRSRDAINGAPGSDW